MPKKAIFSVLFVSWVVLITCLSLIDLSPRDDGLEIPYLDKLVHFTFYLVFVLLGCLAFNLNENKIKLTKGLLILIICAVLYGLIIEALQDVLPVDRSAELLDILANTIGALVGGLLIKNHFSRTDALK